MKKLTALLIMLLSLPLAAAEKVKVVTTFSILADLVQEIGQPHVSVVNLVGPDEDAHVHQPTPNDSRALLEADLIIANGLGSFLAPMGIPALTFPAAFTLTIFTLIAGCSTAPSLHHHC